jgi:hypothetical protein
MPAELVMQLDRNCHAGRAWNDPATICHPWVPGCPCPAPDLASGLMPDSCPMPMAIGRARNHESVNGYVGRHLDAAKPAR